MSEIYKHFSILLAVYEKDDPHLFRKAISSIFLNTYLPRELVIVADGKLTKSLKDVVAEFSTSNIIKFIQLPVNLGLAKALNVGLSHINTDFVLRADADDFNYQNRFELVLSKLDQGFDLVGSAIKEVDKMGREVALRKCPLGEDQIKKFARRRNPFNHMSVGFRIAAVQKVGGYPSIYLKEDYALWAAMLSNGCKVCNLEAVLVDASAGKELFRRRGGMRYAIAEIELQIHLVRCGIKSPISAFFDGIARGLIFLAPGMLREIFYLKFLRNYK